MILYNMKNKDKIEYIQKHGFDSDLEELDRIEYRYCAGVFPQRDRYDYIDKLYKEVHTRVRTRVGASGSITGKDIDDMVEYVLRGAKPVKCGKPTSTLNGTNKACSCGARHSIDPNTHMSWCKLKVWR